MHINIFEKFDCKNERVNKKRWNTFEQPLILLNFQTTIYTRFYK